MCNGCHQFINLQNTPRPRHHSPPFMGLAERPGRTWSRICTRPIAIEPQSVVLIPSLRCAYNKNKNKKTSTKSKKLRKFAKRSDMNFFIIQKKWRSDNSRAETEAETETQELYKRPRLGLWLWCLPRRVRLVVVSVKETKTLRCSDLEHSALRFCSGIPSQWVGGHNMISGLSYDD